MHAICTKILLMFFVVCWLKGVCTGCCCWWRYHRFAYNEQRQRRSAECCEGMHIFHSFLFVTVISISYHASLYVVHAVFVTELQIVWLSATISIAAWSLHCSCCNNLIKWSVVNLFAVFLLLSVIWCTAVYCLQCSKCKKRMPHYPFLGYWHGG